jgi:hypothetical protein
MYSYTSNYLMRMAYVLTKAEIEQELFTFSHFQQAIEEDFCNGKINGGVYSKRLTALVRKGAARISEPHKAKWPNSNWKLTPVAFMDQQTFAALQRFVQSGKGKTVHPAQKRLVRTWMRKAQNDFMEPHRRKA